MTYLTKRVAAELGIEQAIEKQSSILARLDSLERANTHIQRGGETVDPVPQQQSCREVFILPNIHYACDVILV